MELPELDFWMQDVRDARRCLHLTFAHVSNYHNSAVEWRCNWQANMLRRTWLTVLFDDDEVVCAVYDRTYPGQPLVLESLDVVAKAAAHTVYCYRDKIRISDAARARLEWLNDTEAGAVYKDKISAIVLEAYLEHEVALRVTDLREAYRKLRSHVPKESGAIYSDKPELVAALDAIAAVSECDIRLRSMNLKPHLPPHPNPYSWRWSEFDEEASKANCYI